MDRITIDAYDLLADAYDAETTTFWDRFPRDFLDAYASQARGRVLDVGSGPGRDAVLLRDLGLDVTCVDASETMVAMSAARGLASVRADFAKLPFGDAAFGGVWSYTALLHVPKASIDLPLREIHRVLAPGGVLGLGLIEGEGEGYRRSSGVGLPRWFSYYGRYEALAMLDRHGFDVRLHGTMQPGSKTYLHLLGVKRPV